MVFNIYNYHEDFVCCYDYLLLLDPDMDCHLDVPPYFFGPQVPSPIVQPSTCIVSQGPSKLPIPVPIPQSSQTDYTRPPYLGNPHPWWVLSSSSPPCP
jgi:hypothetical protein